MIRDARWKLVYERGRRERTDGYATGRPLAGPTLRLFDLAHDPNEFTNLAARPEEKPRVDRFLALLAEHLKRSARAAQFVPQGQDPMDVLNQGVQPTDETPPAPKRKKR